MGMFIPAQEIDVTLEAFKNAECAASLSALYIVTYN